MKSVIFMENSKRIVFDLAGSVSDLSEIRDFLKGMKNLFLKISGPFKDDPESSYHLLRIECPEGIYNNIKKIINDFIES